MHIYSSLFQCVLYQQRFCQCDKLAAQHVYQEMAEVAKEAAAYIAPPSAPLSLDTSGNYTYQWLLGVHTCMVCAPERIVPLPHVCRSICWVLQLIGLKVALTVWILHFISALKQDLDLSFASSTQI